MVDLYDGPCREGIRGGLEQFKWDSVKDQVIRDRECYLGQSVKIGIQGKFGRFSTNDWWSSKRPDPSVLTQERDILKRLEEELMLEALGVKPKYFSLLKEGLNDDHKAKLMAMKVNDVNEADKQVLPKTSSTHKEKRCADSKRKHDTKSSRSKRQEDTKSIVSVNDKSAKLTGRKTRDEMRYIPSKRKKETMDSYSIRPDDSKEGHFKRKEGARTTHCNQQLGQTLEKGSSKYENHFKESGYYLEDNSFQRNSKLKRKEYVSDDTLRLSYCSRSRDHCRNRHRNNGCSPELYDRRYTVKKEPHLKNRSFGKRRFHS